MGTAEVQRAGEEGVYPFVLDICVLTRAGLGSALVDADFFWADGDRGEERSCGQGPNPGRWGAGFDCFTSDCSVFHFLPS